MILFIGLGNPGQSYQNHRHNIGFMAANAIAEAFSFGPFKSK
ncbi:MAG: aminoacyl-tRNA hydrolase, partial [Sphingomonadales bacterium]